MTETQTALTIGDWLPGFQGAGGLEGINLRALNLALSSPNMVVYALVIMSAILTLKGSAR